MRFYGIHRHTIDAKGRTSIPAPFREALASTPARPYLALNPDPAESHLLLYPPSVWASFVDEVLKHSPFEPGYKELRRTTVSPAEPVEIDKLGRISIPVWIRDQAGLERDVVWVGNVDHVQLWSASGWEKAFEVANSEERREVRDRAAVAWKPGGG